MEKTENSNFIIQKTNSEEKGKNEVEAEIYKYEDIIERYSYFEKHFNPSKDRIYYPYCAGDISPSEAFPKSEIIYVEKEEKYVKLLKEKKLNAYQANAETFNPQEVDILIMLSPEINPKKPSSSVINNGFILCNNHTLTANSLHKEPHLKFHGVLKKEGNQIIFDKENLEKYFVKGKRIFTPRDIFVFQKIKNKAQF